MDLPLVSDLCPSLLHRQWPGNILSCFLTIFSSIICTSPSKKPTPITKASYCIWDLWVGLSCTICTNHVMYRVCILVYVNQLRKICSMKSTGNMDLFLLMFMASPAFPKPSLCTIEKAIKPAEPANGTGFPKWLPLVSQTLLMQRHKSNRLMNRALLL